MEYINKIRSITCTNTNCWLFGLLAILAPGTLILFHFRLGLFLDLNVIKLIILAAALTLPVFLVTFITNSCLFSWLEKTNVIDEEEDSNGNNLCFSLIAANILIYIPLSIAYFSTATFRIFSGMLIAFLLIYILASILLRLKLPNSRKRPVKKAAAKKAAQKKS